MSKKDRVNLYTTITEIVIVAVILIAGVFAISNLQSKAMIEDGAFTNSWDAAREYAHERRCK